MIASRARPRSPATGCAARGHRYAPRATAPTSEDSVVEAGSDSSSSRRSPSVRRDESRAARPCSRRIRGERCWRSPPRAASASTLAARCPTSSSTRLIALAASASCGQPRRPPPRSAPAASAPDRAGRAPSSRSSLRAQLGPHRPFQSAWGAARCSTGLACACAGCACRRGRVDDGAGLAGTMRALRSRRSWRSAAMRLSDRGASERASTASPVSSSARWRERMSSDGGGEARRG
jgi:hypothetical protein